MTVGTFHFDRVKIPSGVTVRFRGFDVMVLESSGDMLIDGILDVSGTDGKPGTDAGGGDGGNGGAAQGGALVGGLVSAVPPRRKEVN